MDEGLGEAVRLQNQAREYLDALITAGVPEKIVVAAMQTALSERLLRSNTVAAAAEFLRGQAEMVEQFGPDLKAAMT